MKKKSSYEDLQGHIRALKTPPIEVFKNQYPDKDYVIEGKYHKFLTFYDEEKEKNNPMVFSRMKSSYFTAEGIPKKKT